MIGSLLALATLCGCVLAPPAPTLVPANDRPFDLARDAFAFVNELEWRYRVDPATGATSSDGANPDAEYTRRCFLLARSARQFFQFARFDPQRLPIDDEGYRRIVREVIGHDPSETAPVERVVVPGFADLREFSLAFETLLKQELGGWSGSEFQRGNWRMILPFRRSELEDTAAALAQEIAVHRPPVVHVADFPAIHINHALLLYRVAEAPEEIRFEAYDPNDGSQPLQLRFERGDGVFRLAPTRYFGGGVVDVYEVYHSMVY
jgi:hypothetical protein